MDYNPSPRDPHKLPLPGFGQFSREELNKFMARTCAPVPTVPWSTGDRHCFKDKIPSSKSQNTDQPLHWENKQEAQSSFTLPQVQQTHNDIPKSWADVVRPNSENSPKGPGTVPPLVNKPTTPNKQAKSVSSPINGKPKAGGLSGILQSYTPTFSSRLLQPRGLVNNGNMCFMNAILQPLSHCPPFYNLLINIGKEVSHNFNSKTPLVDSLIMFMREFRDSKIEEHNGEEFGDPFLPEYVYDALRGAKRFDSMKGRQEDAEEFLGFLLDGLHEELLAASRNTSSEKDGQVESTDRDSRVSD